MLTHVRGGLGVSMVSLVLALGSLASAGCQDPSAPVLPASGSSTIAVSADGARVWVASPESGTVVTYEPTSGAVERYAISGGPVRVARAREQVLVSLSEAGVVAFLRHGSGGVERAGDLAVGERPWGLVVSPDEERAYVALAGKGEVAELDVATRTVLRRFPVDGEPSWLAMDPLGLTLFVAGARTSELAQITLATGVVEWQLLPTVSAVRPVSDATTSHWEVFARTPALTGDPAITPDGARLLLPASYVDTVRPLADTTTASAAVGNYGSSSIYPDFRRQIPAVVALPLDAKGGVIRGRGAALAVSYDATSGAPVISSSTWGGRATAVAAYPWASWVAVAVEGSNALLALKIPDGATLTNTAIGGLSGGSGPMPGDSSGTLSIPGTRPGLGNSLAAVQHGLALQADLSPRGVAFGTEGALWVESRVYGTLARLDAALATEVLDGSRPGVTIEPSRPVYLEPAGDAKAMIGRYLFLAPTLQSMFNGETTCASCHPERGSDGRTWVLPSGEAKPTPALSRDPSPERVRAWMERAAGGAVGDDAVDAMLRYLRAQ